MEIEEHYMEPSITSATPEDVIAEALGQHGSDRAFWQFAEDFARTVGYDLANTNTAKTARLVSECARQFGYLRNEHPDYFKRLSAGTGENLAVLLHVAEIAVVSDIPVHHFAGSNIFVAAFEERREHHARMAEEELKAQEAAEAARRADEERAAAARKELNIAAIPVDGFAVPVRELSTQELEKLAQDFYAQSKGRLVKVYDHIPDGGDNFGYKRTSKVFARYDVALVDEGGEEYVGLTAPQGRVAESTWPVVMMTGPNRGMKASIAALDFNADGSVTGNDLALVSLPGFVLPERLQDSELIELVRLDMHDYAERPIDVTAASVYFAGTDDQDYISFDPPLPSVVDPFDDELRDFTSMYRIDDWSQRDGISVIDVYLDFESTDERADKYRSMWTHGVSYTSHGLVEVGETPALPFIPEFVARKKNRGAEDIQTLAR
jgi:hypothetical protein